MEIFYTMAEARILIEQWRVHYNTVRPHSAPRYRPPAPLTSGGLPLKARNPRIEYQAEVVH